MTCFDWKRAPSIVSEVFGEEFGRRYIPDRSVELTFSNCRWGM
jgi:hypothetical protein